MSSLGFDFSFGEDKAEKTVGIIETFSTYLAKIIEIIKQLFGLLDKDDEAAE